MTKPNTDFLVRAVAYELIPHIDCAMMRGNAAAHIVRATRPIIEREVLREVIKHHGVPASEILQYAREHNIDLTVEE